MSLKATVAALLLLSGAEAQTVLGSFIFARHGDRLTKPTVYLSPIGADEVLDAGSFFHDRYFTDSETTISGLKSVYAPTQIYVSVPNSDVLAKSSQAFMQGFYPAVTDDEESSVQGSSLANGTVDSTPLDGYQYVYITGIDDSSDDYWKIKGDEDCPAFTTASNAYLQSSEFKSLNSSTLDFYQSLSKYVDGSIKKSKLNYGNAFTVFDYFLVNSVHNQTFAESINGTDVFEQVRTLQDIYSKNLNWNTSSSVTAIGGATLLGQVNEFLDTAKNSSQPQKMEVMFGSYDQFYQAFGLLGWFGVDEAKFTGIVDYASALVFELVENNGSQYVRAGLRNGTDISQTSADLEFFPTFGKSDELVSLSDFQSSVSSVAVSDAATWCTACSSTEGQCEVKTLQDEVNSLRSNKSKLSLADAGGIGAGVTIGVFLILGAAAFLLFRMRSAKPAPVGETKGSGESVSTQATHV